MKIFIAAHKKSLFPNYDYYVPIQVGTDINGIIDEFKIRDNTLDNISKKNKNYCELTAMYWIWKNIDDDIIGLTHYRRYFYKKPYHNTLDNVLSKDEIIDILKNKKIIVPNKKYFFKNNLYHQYRIIHNVSDLEKCKQIIIEKYPDYINSFDKVFKRKWMYSYNMFIASKSIMNEYFNWLFNILFELEKRVDISEYNQYNQRIFGFLSERLFNVWIDKNFDKKEVQEVFVSNLDTDQKKEFFLNVVKKVGGLF